jgi:hypothetical protein
VKTSAIEKKQIVRHDILGHWGMDGVVAICVGHYYCFDDIIYFD